MGCCVSSEGGYNGGGGGGSEYDAKGGSFPSMEEETVKEVLSETHISRPACFTSRDNAANRKSNARRINVGVNDVMMMKALDAPSSVTDHEVSEAESLSTMVERREQKDQNEYLYNGFNYSQCRDRTPVKGVRSRSNSGDLGRQRSGRKSSPARKQDPSPRRRNEGSGTGNGNGVRSVSRQESPAWDRPDAGERSGRRSRSPGMRAEGNNGGNRSGVGRSPSGRKIGQSPNRTRGGGPPGSSRKSDTGGEEGGRWAQADESLENPLVALECFIFL